MFKFANMVVLKLTKDCNLNCEYCYVKHKENFKGQMIDFEIYKSIIERIIKDRKNQGNKTFPRIDLIFHGGEPLLAKKEYLVKLLDYASTRFKESLTSYSLGIQTNLTLLDDDYSAILSKYDVNIGGSFDGIGDANESRTPIKQDFFEKKFKILEKYNNNYGFLIVAGEGNINSVQETYNYLVDNYNQEDVRINYVEDVNNIGKGEVDGKIFVKNAWIPFIERFILTGKMNEGNMILVLKKWVNEVFLGEKLNAKTNCADTFCGAGINIVEVEPDGNVYYCGRYSEADPEAYIEHVNDKDFLALRQIKRYFDFVENKQKVILEANCDTCIAKNICDHGCMAFHKAKFGTWGIRKDIVCPTYIELWKYMTENGHRILSGFLVDKNEHEIEFYNQIRLINYNKKIFKKLKKEYNIDVYIHPDKNNVVVLKKL